MTQRMRGEVGGAWEKALKAGEGEEVLDEAAEPRGLTGWVG